MLTLESLSKRSRIGELPCNSITFRRIFMNAQWQHSRVLLKVDLDR